MEMPKSAVAYDLPNQRRLGYDEFDGLLWDGGYLISNRNRSIIMY
ncbi:hypothetical protein HNR39_003733 [Glaciimonas immobilis]|uniref:Uncharacterized protein n=1 Tax=Glaciimonas immobilis TaxID=728004 RepID=A0A840RZF4_9BURK|nr:hypothetical protein [Glaciimonas immobilis]